MGSTPAMSVGMIPPRYDIVKQHPCTVSVMAAGGSETSAMWKSQLSDEEFSLALIEAIKNSRTFSQIIKGAGADYALHITIFSVGQPSFGTSFTVKMEVGWTLKRRDGNAAVWQESIKSEHPSAVIDAFAAATRLRLATEGAARNNIAEGLVRISKLNL
ncbi:MAG: hypothetical protein JW943_06860 [Deltaproteobacteria bacterium]|nr:hypothetical protein [Deltaproteobacteria bacterium]